MDTMSHRPGRVLLTWPVYTLTYLLMATTGLGYLALTWSTVVLLGGFVTSLQRKDFWCLTVISMIQAARIFNDLGEKLATKGFQHVNGMISGGVEWLASNKFCVIIFATAFYMPWLLFLVACYIVLFLYMYGGPIACIALALWRIVQRDYSSNDGDITKANLPPALDLFYCLILCQGAFYMIWLFVNLLVAIFGVIYIRSLYKIPRKWGNIWLIDYLVDTRAKCWRDTASIEGRTISHYAVDLINSKSWDDQLYGMRMLATFIKQGDDVRSMLLPSRPLIQKLIDILGWRSGVSWEGRVAAARIVAHLACDIHLAQFPGATQCISTLLRDEATTIYWWNCDQKQAAGRPQLLNGSGSTMLKLVHRLTGSDHDSDQDGVDEGDAAGSNELILQGLMILERLASDHHNCMEICSVPVVVLKIMVPLSSNTLTQGVKNSAWAEVVNGTLKVLYRLVRCSGMTGESLRREIATNKQAISNLESFLNQSNEAGKELQMRAMEILTELALDSSTNLTVGTKGNLMKKQLEIFLDEESPATSKELKATAGRALAFLTTNSEVNSAVVVKDSFGSLTELLDANNTTTYYRVIAAQILENICAHCDLDKECVKDTLLPQVLAELLSNNNEPSQRAEEKLKKSAPVDDEENQNELVAANGDENLDISDTEIQEISSTTDENKSSDQGSNDQAAIYELQGAFLSLGLVIYDKLISTDDFNDAVQKKCKGHGEFVLKLKTILEEDCKDTVTSLRIVKLCGKIVASMLARNQYTEHFKNQGFVETLSKTKERMSNLESCILFAGTENRDPWNHYLKKIAMPLLSEIEKEVVRLVG